MHTGAKTRGIKGFKRTFVGRGSLYFSFIKFQKKFHKRLKGSKVYPPLPPTTPCAHYETKKLLKTLNSKLSNKKEQSVKRLKSKNIELFQNFNTKTYLDQFMLSV